MDWESLVWRTSLPPTRKFVLAALSRCVNASGIAPITTLQLAALTGLTQRSVREQMMLAEAAGNVRRILPKGFQITLIQTDSTRGTTFLSPNLRGEPRSSEGNHVPLEIPFPLNNPLSNPPPSLSPVSSFSSVPENKELGQETISVVAGGQAELISTELPEWATRLLELPTFAKRGINAKDVTRIETDFPGINYAIEAGTFIERFRHETVKRPMATWRNWLKKEKRDDSGNGRQNGRYVAPEFLPNTRDYYEPGSKLSAFRR